MYTSALASVPAVYMLCNHLSAVILFTSIPLRSLVISMGSTAGHGHNKIAVLFLDQPSDLDRKFTIYQNIQ